LKDFFAAKVVKMYYISTQGVTWLCSSSAAWQQGNLFEGKQAAVS
jgi:hypothetical protein